MAIKCRHGFKTCLKIPALHFSSAFAVRSVLGSSPPDQIWGATCYQKKIFSIVATPSLMLGLMLTRCSSVKFRCDDCDMRWLIPIFAMSLAMMTRPGKSSISCISYQQWDWQVIWTWVHWWTGSALQWRQLEGGDRGQTTPKSICVLS